MFSLNGYNAIDRLQLAYQRCNRHQELDRKNKRLHDSRVITFSDIRRLHYLAMKKLDSLNDRLISNDNRLQNSISKKKRNFEDE